MPFFYVTVSMCELGYLCFTAISGAGLVAWGMKESTVDYASTVYFGVGGVSFCLVSVLQWGCLFHWPWYSHCVMSEVFVSDRQLHLHYTPWQ